MWVHLLTILHLFASDVQMPLNLNETLVSATEDFAPGPILVLDNHHTSGTLAPITERPQRDTVAEVPDVVAERAFIMDADSGQILLAKNADQKAPMASIAKLMTAMVVLEQPDSLEDIVEVPADISRLDPEGTAAGLVIGESYDVESLLRGLLIASANDAAVSLAVGISGSQKIFVQEMNDYADRLGLTDTVFGNVTGLDDEDNQSTARDVAFLLQAASRYPLIAEFSTRSSDTIYSFEGSRHYLTSTNKLLTESDLAIEVGKTGTTDLAGASLGIIASQDGHRLISVVMDSQERFAESERLLSEVVDVYTWAGDDLQDTRFGEEQSTEFGG